MHFIVIIHEGCPRTYDIAILLFNSYTVDSFQSTVLRGVKEWVHRKTTKIIHDFNSFCNLDLNQKLVSVMIIKISYLCILHNAIISPAHLCCLHVVALAPTCFSINGRVWPTKFPVPEVSTSFFFFL